jgi:6-phosphogluconolactonase
VLTPVDDVVPAFTVAVVEAFGARSGPRFALVLSGGPVAKACYEALARTPGIDWGLVDVYIGDERFVPHGHEDANVRMIREALLDRIEPVGSFTPMPTGGTPEACAAAYQRVVADLVTGAGIDVIHLGMGPDGHTASLFPGAASLDAGPGDLVVATEDPSRRNPHPRLTFTLPAINSARLALFTVAGETHAPAVAALVRGEDLPAARVHAHETVWLVDGAARGDGP